MKSQHEKATEFRALHHRDIAFTIPNPWDVGSARLLAGLGFEALATTSDDIATLVREVDRPVNVVMGLQSVQLTLAQLSQMGVKRISVGSALLRAALGAFLRAAPEMKEHGTFTFAADAVSYGEISGLLSE